MNESDVFCLNGMLVMVPRNHGSGINGEKNKPLTDERINDHDLIDGLFIPTRNDDNNNNENTWYDPHCIIPVEESLEVADLVLCVAAAQGNEHIVRLCVDQFNARPEAVDKAIVDAAMHGHESIVRLCCHDYGASFDALRTATVTAACQGHVSIVNWCYREVMMFIAAKHASQDEDNSERTAMVEFVLDVVRSAARAGQLDVVQLIYAIPPHGAVIDTSLVMCDAAISGHQHVVAWLYDVCGMTGGLERVLIEASTMGHDALVQWSLEKMTHVILARQETQQRHDKHLQQPSQTDMIICRDPSNWCSMLRCLVMDAIEWAIVNGHLCVVRMLLGFVKDHVLMQCPVTLSEARHFTTLASLHGRLDLVCYLQHIYAFEPDDQNAFLMAAVTSGNLSLIQLMHTEYGATGALSNIVNIAAQNGHIHVLRMYRDFFSATSVDLMNEAMHVAAHAGHASIVQMCYKEYGATSVDEAMYQAAWGGHLDIVRQCHELYGAMDLHSTMMAAAIGGHEVIIRYCHARLKSPVNINQLMVEAAACGRDNIVRLCIQEYGATDLKRALHNAKRFDHIELVQWLQSQ